MQAAELLDRWYAAWNDHDAEAIASLVAPDVHYEAPTGSGAPLRGRRAVRIYARFVLLAVPDLRFEKLEEWVSPGGLVVSSYFTVSGTRRPRAGEDEAAPRRFEALGMDRSEIADGLLTRHQIFWNGQLHRALAGSGGRS